MNKLISNNELTMSTISLCEVINNFRTESSQNEIRYYDFIARVEDELDDLQPNEIFVNPSNNKETKFYTLNKDQTLLVGMRESKVVRKKVLAWIKSIENQQPALPDFNNPVESARAWADAKESEQKALEVIKQQAPAVEFVANYTKAETGSKGFREVAKLLKIKEKEFRTFLVDHKIMYKLAGNWTAYANHIDTGRFEVTTGETNGHVHNTTKFTGKGIEWIAGLYAQHQISEK